MEVHRPKFVKGLIEEILIIVISISLAVGAERIVENWVHNKEGKEALINLKTELIRDSIDLNFNLDIYKETIVGEDLLYKWSRSNYQLSDDSIKSLAELSLGTVFFANNISEFESLKFSNKLSYISNHELVQEIVKNYDRYDDFKSSDKGMSTVFYELLSFYRNNTSIVSNEPFSGKALFGLNGKEIKKTLYHDTKFENLLQVKLWGDKSMKQATIIALSRIRKIITEINKEIREEK